MNPSEDTKIAVLQNKMDNLEKKVDKVDAKQDALSCKIDRLTEKIDDTYVRKDDFTFWRNLLVAGILGVLAVGIISKLLLP